MQASTLRKTHDLSSSARSMLYDEMLTELPKLRRYAWVLTRNETLAGDLVQTGLARCFAKAHLFESGTNLRAWMFTILHNEYVNFVRRETRMVLVPLTTGDWIKMTSVNGHSIKPNQGVSLSIRDLERALLKLPLDQRQTILLIGFEGLSYAEAAEVMEVPVGTVRSRLSRGRDHLRSLMFGDDSKPASEIRVDDLI